MAAACDPLFQLSPLRAPLRSVPFLLPPFDRDGDDDGDVALFSGSRTCCCYRRERFFACGRGSNFRSMNLEKPEHVPPPQRNGGSVGN